MGIKTVFLAFVVLILIAISILLWLINVYIYTYTVTPAVPPMSPVRGVLALALPVGIAKWGLKRQSLSKTGAAAGLIVGMIMILSSYCFFASLLAFFVLGSKVTKYKTSHKKKMEADFKEGGQRNWIQVLCNGGIATQVAIFYLMDHGSGETTVDFSNHFSASCWAMAILGSLASSSGDTFASEIGSVWNLKSQPRLITQLKQRVPHGTNGGVSVTGTVASIIGGALVGVAYYIALTVCVCADGLQESPHQYLVIVIAALAGGIGSAIDSLIGATLQFSGCDEHGRVVDHPGRGVKHISGIQLLDNHSVNLLTSLAMAIITPYMALYCFGLYA